MTSTEETAQDDRVRTAIYEAFREGRGAPSRSEVGRRTGLPDTAVAKSFRRLADAHVLVLRDNGDLWMAMPFSAVATDVRVVAGDREWWANCAWDALGIAAALRADVRITSPCPDCGEPAVVDVTQGRLQRSEPSQVVHFAVPAAAWWDDIGFT